jgi:hypothetical protein
MSSNGGVSAKAKIAIIWTFAIALLAVDVALGALHDVPGILIGVGGSVVGIARVKSRRSNPQPRGKHQ